MSLGMQKKIYSLCRRLFKNGGVGKGMHVPFVHLPFTNRSISQQH